MRVRTRRIQVTGCWQVVLVKLHCNNMAATIQSTPQKVKPTSENSYTHAPTLDKARDALVRTATATQVSLNIIVDNLFPFVTSTEVNQVITQLESQGKLKGEGWTAFEPLCSRKGKGAMSSHYEPCHSSKNEDTTFKFLEQVFEQVQQAYVSVHNRVADNDLPKGGRNGSTGQTPLVKLSIHGHKNLAGDWSNSTRPDGSIHLKESSLPWPRAKKQDSGGAYYVIDYADICLLIEAKLHLTRENMNAVRPSPNNAIKNLTCVYLKEPEQVAVERPSQASLRSSLSIRCRDHR